MLRRRLRHAPALVAGFVASVVVVCARADQPERTDISLAEARARAVLAAPDVVLAHRRETIARAQVDVAGALANPTLTMQSARLSARITTGVSVPLPLFGQRATAVAAARSDADAVMLETGALQLEARWTATRAWLDLWEAQERARLLEVAATDAERVATIARERFGAGSAPRLDAVRTHADQARARAEVIAARANVAAASAHLALALGAAPSAFTPPLSARGAPALGALPSERAALDGGLALHPALARDRAQSAAADAHLRAEQRLRWPIVNAGVTISQLDPTTPGTDVIGGLVLEAPVLSQRGGAIARARAERELAETVTALETRRLQGELDAAYEQARAAAVRADALGKDVLPALEEARRMTEEGYRDGRVDLLRLLESQRALLEGRAASLEAQATAQRALADVERALGAPLAPGVPRAP